jgi:hypothetical protein
MWNVVVMVSFDVLSQHLLGRTEENLKKSQDSWPPDNNLSTEPPEYEQMYYPFYSGVQSMLM